MKKLLRYISSYKKECILSPLFKLFEACFELTVPIIVAKIVDVGIKSSDLPYILKMGIVLVILGVVGLACALSAQFFAAKAAVGFATKLRSVLFSHIQSLSHSEADKIGTSELVTKMTSDINQVQTGTNLMLRLFMRSPFIVFGAMIMAFFIDAKASLIFVAVILVLFVIVFGIMFATIPLYKRVQQKLDVILNLVRENLTGTKVIRAFNREKEEEKDFEENNSALTKELNFAGKLSSITNPLTYVVINIGLITLIYTGALRVNSGALTQGQVIALISYISQILIELIKLANLIVSVTKAITCANRIQEVLEEKSSLTSPLTSPEESSLSVEFKNVSFTYGSASEPSLKNISFIAQKGETVGIIGGTGTGKSTLVKLLPRYYDATEGEVLINGINVKDYPLDAVRKKTAFVLQKAALVKGTIRENLSWGKENPTDEEIEKALEISQSLDFVKQKDGYLDFEIAQNGKNLSGGQRQRLTVARAIIAQSEIIVLDDSSSALDYATDAKMRKAIKELDYEPIIFIVSQRTSSIMHADKIIVLDDGEAVGIGTHSELLDTCEVYREIYESQYKAGEDR